MQRTCILCNQEFEVIDDAEVHEMEAKKTLCRSCAGSMCTDKKCSLTDLLNTLSVPVFCVNEQGIVELANQSASRYFHKDMHRMQGARGGEVFECANADLPGGCGNTIHCSSCTLRRTVMKTFETGISIVRQPASLKIVEKGEIKKTNFFVTTIKHKNYVILRIEGLKSW